MKILLAGLPGSGKSTQAQKLAEYLDVEFISMGKVLRDMAQEDSDQAKRFKEIIGSGDLVDDSTVAEIMRKKLESSEYSKGFILDGYPRTVDQLNIFDPNFDKVFYLQISLEEGLRRLLERGREDDNEAVVKKRYQAQQKKLEQVLNYFRQQGILVEIDGNKKIPEIFEEIKSNL